MRRAECTAAPPGGFPFRGSRAPRPGPLSPVLLFSDTLLALERVHLLRLVLWGASSVLAGTFLLALLALRGRASSLVRHFAIQTAVWGVVDVARALVGRGPLASRDFAGALALDRLVWLSIGLDTGCIGLGVTLVLCGWRLGHRRGVVGGGVAVTTQGLALLILDVGLVVRLDAAL